MDNSSHKISDLLNKFPSIDLEGMEEYALMKRVETKYLMSYQQFLEFIETCDDRFFILEINNKRLHHYKSRYFDTKGLKSYYDHHNGKSNRYKIRFRKYDSSAACFIEFKRKNLKGEIVKQRKVSEWKDELGKKDCLYIQSVDQTIELGNLEQSVNNEYDRITLLDKESKERMTFDLNLNFNHQGNQDEVSEIVIGELKQEKKAVSTISSFLNKQGITPTSFSKYCTGVVLLKPDVKKNNFKKNLIKIGKWVS
jgi:hypothetical protein